MLCILLFLTACRSSIHVQSQVFGIDYWLSVLNGNTVKFYIFHDEWKEQERFAFNLPNGYKSVFGFGIRNVAVVVENTIRFYDYGIDDNDSFGWEEGPSVAFNLPNGYESVFGFGLCIGVIVGNTVKFYVYNFYGDEWEEFPWAFNLPNGYKNVFFGPELGDGVYGIGVVVGNTLKFYGFRDEWEELESFTFNLPKGYDNVFTIKLPKWYGVLNVDSWNLGVVVGNTVEFYHFNDKEWVELQEIKFRTQ
jgi:uncharacterized membrane protein